MDVDLIFSREDKKPSNFVVVKFEENKETTKRNADYVLSSFPFSKRRCGKDRLTEIKVEFVHST